MDRVQVIEKFRNRELPKSFVARVTPEELAYFRLAMHPTKKAHSKEVTKQIIGYMAERELVTSQELQEVLGLAEMTVLKRLSIFLTFKLVKRELHRYYIVTPRLREIAARYMSYI